MKMKTIFKSTKECKEFLKAIKKSNSFVLLRKDCSNDSTVYIFTEKKPDNGILKIKLLISNYSNSEERTKLPSPLGSNPYFLYRYKDSWIEISYLSEDGEVISSIDECINLLGDDTKEFLIYNLDIFS